MNTDSTITQGLAHFLDRVSEHLTAKPPDQRCEILADLESHIHEALTNRAAGRQPTADDLKAVLTEMDPPESYGPLPPQELMPQKNVSVPRDLRIVAYIHLAVGILSVITFFVLLTQNTFSIQFGILGIFIFFGLLKLRNGWRICAMVMLWFGLIGFPLIFLLGLSGAVPAYFEMFGIRIARIHPLVVSVTCIPFFLFVFWQYRVLIRPDIKALFYPQTGEI